MSKKNPVLRLASVFALSLALVGATPAESPVADAAQANDTEQVRTLLRQGADANAAQSDGLTALHWAALNGNAQMVDLLLYAGATVEPLTRVGGYTPLHLAARSGHAGVVEKLLAGGAEVDAWTTTGVTALHFAAAGDFHESVRLLAAAGADVNAGDGFQHRTPLVFAAQANATRAIEALLAAGADPSVTTELKNYVARSEIDSDERARRARIRAAQAGEDQVSNDNSDRIQAQTPPDTAAADPDEEEEEKAEEEKPKEKKPEEPPIRALSSTEQIGVQGGFTALHYAARQGNLEAAELLLDGGADIAER